jgi:hypothetical protein
MNDRVQPLRDIRDDLTARLRVAASKHKHFSNLANEAASDMDMLQRLIERENVRLRAEEPSRPVPSEDLPDFLYNAIRTRPMSKEAMRLNAVAAGYKVDGRNVHAITVNLHRSGKIVELAEGVFAAADSDLVKSALHRAG